MVDDGNDKKRPLSRSEKFRNYCIGIAALTGLFLGILNIVMGEPRAEKTWTTLRDQTNALTETVNKLTKRVLFLQAHESGRTAAEVQLKLEAAEKKLAKLTAAQAVQAPKEPQPKVGSAGAQVVSAPQKKCREGFILVDNQCRHVHKSVVKKMEKDAAEKADAQRRLFEEKRKRLEEERRRWTLMQQIKAPPAPKPLPKLPFKLDEAGK